MILEVATFNLKDAFAAAQVGADRLEVCTNYKMGGLSPPAEWIFALRQTISIPVISIVRPRGGDFFYSVDEISEMRNQGHSLKTAGSESLVFGCLNKDHSLDIKTCHDLILDWRSPTVLHRAFDECNDPFKAVDHAIEAGFHRILTAKGAKNMDLLKNLRNYANDRIEILPGGGIRSSNIDQYINSSFQTIHSSAITGKKNKMDPGEIALLKLKLLNFKTTMNSHQ